MLGGFAAAGPASAGRASTTRAVLQAIAAEAAAARSPPAFDVRRRHGTDARRAAARLVGLRRRAASATAIRRSAPCSHRAAARAAPRPPCSASPSRRTSRVLDGADARRVPWLAVCLPSRWAPRGKLGRSLRRDPRAGRRQRDAGRGERVAGAAGHRRRALGALRLDGVGRSAPASASGARRDGRGRAERRCRRARRARVVSQRAPDLHPDRRTARRPIFTIRVDSVPLAERRGDGRCARAAPARRARQHVAGGARLSRPRRGARAPARLARGARTARPLRAR